MTKNASEKETRSAECQRQRRNESGIESETGKGNGIESGMIGSESDADLETASGIESESEIRPRWRNHCR